MHFKNYVCDGPNRSRQNKLCKFTGSQQPITSLKQYHFRSTLWYPVVLQRCGVQFCSAKFVEHEITFCPLLELLLLQLVPSWLVHPHKKVPGTLPAFLSNRKKSSLAVPNYRVKSNDILCGCSKQVQYAMAQIKIFTKGNLVNFENVAFNVISKFWSREFLGTLAKIVHLLSSFFKHLPPTVLNFLATAENQHTPSEKCGGKDIRERFMH